jgi:hypothetical protein
MTPPPLFGDPDEEQARIFLDLLDSRLRLLDKEIRFAQGAAPENLRSLHAEIRAIRGYIDRIHRRFPATRETTDSNTG